MQGTKREECLQPDPAFFQESPDDSTRILLHCFVQRIAQMVRRISHSGPALSGKSASKTIPKPR
jgi:hypothetical protein